MKAALIESSGGPEVLVYGEVPDPIAGSIHVTGKMIKLSRTPMVVGSAPKVGEHSQEVLSDILGYSDDRISELHEAGIVRSRDRRRFPASLRGCRPT